MNDWSRCAGTGAGDPAWVIETCGLVRRFAGRTALDHLDLRIPTGGVHALIGRNGAGKSTLFEVLLGLQAASGGTSRVLGWSSQALPPEVRGRIGFVAEGHPLPDWFRVGELAELERACHPRFDKTIFREIASLFSLASEQRVSELSGGERAGLALALAIAPGPELLLLDEPTAGLDIVASRSFVESLLFAGERELGTVVLSSHRLAEVERIADRLWILDRGALVTAGTSDELRARIHSWTVLEWPPALDPVTLPGLLEARRIDDELHLVVLDAPPDFAQRLAEMGARGVAVRPLGFERAIDALLQGGRREVGRR